MAKKKLVGWGANIIEDSELGSYEDIVMNSAQLSVEEGQETEANVEGGEAEASRKDIDKYTLTCNRRIDDASEVSAVLGYTEEVENVSLYPKNGGVGVKLDSPSRHVAVKMDSTDGLVAVYTYKTKGKNDGAGHPTDVHLGKASAPVFTAVGDPSGKSPKDENWYVLEGSDYVRSYDEEPQPGVTYYERS